MRRSAVNALGVCAMDPRDDEPETDLDRHRARLRLATDLCREIAAERGRLGWRDLGIFQFRKLGIATEDQVATVFKLTPRRVRQIVEGFASEIEARLGVQAGENVDELVGVG